MHRNCQQLKTPTSHPTYLIQEPGNQKLHLRRYCQNCMHKIKKHDCRQIHQITIKRRIFRTKRKNENTTILATYNCGEKLEYKNQNTCHSKKQIQQHIIYHFFFLIYSSFYIAITCILIIEYRRVFHKSNKIVINCRFTKMEEC